MTHLFSLQHDIASAIVLTLLHSLWIGAVIYDVVHILVQHLEARSSGRSYALSVIGMLIYLFTVILLFTRLYEPYSLKGNFIDRFSLYQYVFQGSENKAQRLVRQASFESHY